jgi:RNA polymerase sigma factor (sigma-70 family)
MSLTATSGQETAATGRRPHLGTLSTCTLRHAADDRLVTLTRGGSERAFAEIMRRYQRPLHYYCLQMVGAARAEDAVQQTFMQAFVALRDGERREIALRPWLYRIARNCAIDLLRKHHEHDELDPDFDGMPQTAGVFEQKEEFARVVAAIRALPEGQRRALTLRELEGRSYGEISAELGHTDSGVRQLIFRARTALRNLGALVLPLGSIRWRFLSAPSTAAADPHGVAVAAGVSSGGGGGALQAAGSVVAATLTLLGTAPAPRHHQPAAAGPAPIVAAAPVATPAFRASAGVTLAPAVRASHGGTGSIVSGSTAPVQATPAAVTAPVTQAVPPAEPAPAVAPVAPPDAVVPAAAPVTNPDGQAPALVAASAPVDKAADATTAADPAKAPAGAPVPVQPKPVLVAKPPTVKPVPVAKPQPAKPAPPKPAPAQPAPVKKPVLAAPAAPAKATSPVA